MSDPTPVEGFKRSAQGRPCELPSGNVARIKNPGMQAFLQKGMIPDTLTPIVKQALEKGKEGTDIDKIGDMVSDPEKLSDVLELFDIIVMETWTEPRVQPIPKRSVAEAGSEKTAEMTTEVVPFEERDPKNLYIDEIEFDDKVFTFQFAVGGVRDLETFRSQQEEMLERVSARSDMGGSTE